MPTKDLPPILKNVMGVRQYEECPVCDAVVILAVLLVLSLSAALLCTSFE